MNPFETYLLENEYRKLAKLGDRLAEAEKQVDWEAFRPIIKPIYNNNGPSGGRPNTDEVVMMKLLVLQAWYGLSDPELVQEAARLHMMLCCTRSTGRRSGWLRRSSRSTWSRGERRRSRTV